MSRSVVLDGSVVQWTLHKLDDAAVGRVDGLSRASVSDKLLRKAKGLTGGGQVHFFA